MARFGGSTSGGRGTSDIWCNGSIRGSRYRGRRDILAAGEVVLGPGESVTTPWAYAVYSRQGLDGASARVHSMLRRRDRPPLEIAPGPVEHMGSRHFRPVLRDIGQSWPMWPPKSASSASLSTTVGSVRRRDDSAGLGDWYVAKDVWPQGLGPIVDHVRSLGHGVRAVVRARDGKPGLATWPAPIRTGSWGRRGGCRPAGATSRSWTSPTRTLMPTSWSGWTPW